MMSPDAPDEFPGAEGGKDPRDPGGGTEAEGGADPFVEALRDYRFLLDRGYSDRSACVLVGNRHSLEAAARLELFRGVASRRDSEARRSLLGQPLPGDLVLLDAYNVAFTLVHYLVGKPCFLATDGYLRDAGANYGRVPREELLARAFTEIAAFVAGRGLAISAFLDAPVSRSAAHAAALREAFALASVEAEVGVAKSADGAILAALARAGGAAEAGRSVFVASSDSALVARSPAAWDLARALLEFRYGAVFPDFGAYLGR